MHHHTLGLSDETDEHGNVELTRLNNKPVYSVTGSTPLEAWSKVLIQLGDEIDPDDPWSVSGHETLKILQSATDARGKKLEIIRLPDPVNIRSRKADFVASYVNYYICNGAVICA